MRSVLEHNVLVLNRNWMAIGYSTVRDAILLMTRDAARGLCVKTYRAFTWDDWTTDTENPPEVSSYIQSGSGQVPAPDVIILTRFDRLYYRNVRFSKKALFRRDDFTCGYCGEKFPEDELSVDHIIPRARKGKTSWTNCITSCVYCNCSKGDYSLEDAGLKLLKEPTRPTWHPIVNIRKDLRPESWTPFLKPEWLDD